MIEVIYMGVAIYRNHAQTFKVYTSTNSLQECKY
jgi:hypothetical protein